MGHRKVDHGQVASSRSCHEGVESPLLETFGICFRFQILADFEVLLHTVR